MSIPHLDEQGFIEHIVEDIFDFPFKFAFQYMCEYGPYQQD